MGWIYKDKEIKTEKDVPKEFKKFYGFIYIIYIDEKYYIGQKTFRLKNNRKIGKKELETYPDKRLLRRRKVKRGKDKGSWVYFEERYKEDWLEYTGSSDVVNKMVAEGKPYKKEIIKLVKNKGMMNYLETKEIMCSNCMEVEECLNDHVGNFYKKNIIGK